MDLTFGMALHAQQQPSSSSSPAPSNNNNADQHSLAKIVHPWQLDVYNAYAYAEAYETVEQYAKVVSNHHPSYVSPFNHAFGQPSSSYVNPSPTLMDLDVIQSYGHGDSGPSNNMSCIKCFCCSERGHIHHDCHKKLNGLQAKDRLGFWEAHI
ncbi:hypothetical protein BDA99DRAFT_566388 [Phascolomyces articulosus]|uniref:CCHC-type domain-containing protein n=1 Tax=Phascolomyces articulosus TaxID=60185 RepID=A0AAD5P7H4_9FUNG|nr:hypothetical protein BDA99DRAFT_566388 [Phascolomyces articulosus]